MRIAIAGAGISGAYMYRLLKGYGHDVTIFDKENITNCGISPCAWGTSKGFEDLVGRAGLNPNDYILRSIDHIWFDEIRIKAYMLTIDKRKLIMDLLGDAEINEAKSLRASHYDRIIDATGVARAYLPPIPNDLISPCYQYRMVSDEPPEMRIKIGRVGYAWSFPLTDKQFHIGAGSLVTDPIGILKDLKWIYPHSSNKVKCACYSNVRLTAPRRSRPFTCEYGSGECEIPQPKGIEASHINEYLSDSQMGLKSRISYGTMPRSSLSSAFRETEIERLMGTSRPLEPDRSARIDIDRKTVKSNPYNNNEIEEGGTIHPRPEGAGFSLPLCPGRYNPDGSLKTKGEIWGIGEAIGCVAPLAGDGIIHGMRTALFLLENIDSPADYERAILNEFAWMEKEREVVERLQSGKPIGLGSALVLQRNTRRMDMKMGLWDAFKILWRARK